MELCDVTKTAFCTTLNWNQDAIQIDDALETLPDWDSVNQLRVLMALEAALGIKLPVKQYVNCRSITEVTELVARLKSSA